MTLPDVMLHPRLYRDDNEVTRPEQAFEINKLEVSELIRDSLNFFGFNTALDEAEDIFDHDTTLAQVSRPRSSKRRALRAHATR